MEMNVDHAEIKTPILTDAQAMAVAHPATFEAPDPADLRRVAPGACLKVCAARERFWVEVEMVEETEDGPIFTGRIENQLIATRDHGLVFGDRIRFGYQHVYSVMDRH